MDVQTQFAPKLKREKSESTDGGSINTEYIKQHQFPQDLVGRSRLRDVQQRMWQHIKIILTDEQYRENKSAPEYLKFSIFVDFMYKNIQGMKYEIERLKSTNAYDES